MNKFFNIRWVLGLALSLSLCAASLTEALAQSTPAASTAAADAPAKAEAPAEAKAAAPVQAGADAKAEDKAQASEAKAEAAPTPPAPNKGDTAWMMVATLLVVMMAVPGLALFYGGLVRAKKCAVSAYASQHGLLADRGAVGRLWIQPCLYWRLSLHRRT